MTKALFVAILAVVLLAPSAMQLIQAGSDPCPDPDCREITICQKRTTERFIRVGHSCARAKERATDAAHAAAQCKFFESPCGPTTVFVSHDCFPHPVSGQTAAEAFAEYECQFTIIDCDIEPCIG